MMYCAADCQTFLAVVPKRSLERRGRFHIPVQTTFLSGDEMNIFVGNLGPEIAEAELAELFKRFGEVKSVQISRALFTGESKGFAFVEMPGKRHSLAAIAGLDGKDFAGRPLKVSEARPKPVRGRSPRR
jgi:RNA recognition motif-containing protein